MTGGSDQGPKPVVKELRGSEFPLADEVWIGYHGTKGDPKQDRIFGVFAEGRLVSLARCKRHPDGLEVDGIYTPPEMRGRGYAKKAVAALVEACHHDTLYMHSVLNLTGFYAEFGFEMIDEKELPPTILARYQFAMGNLEGSNVQPMRRRPGLDRLLLRE
jgi:GNAT superfamily N-acetyltransferase